jgi:hypothetical protein
MDDQKLDSLFRSAPTEATPPRDLWPAVEQQLREHRYARNTAFLRIAAALTLFLVGAATGIGFERSRQVDATAADETIMPTTTFLAAAAVQEAGTEYLAALTRLASIDEGPETTAAFAQGVEASLATLETAAVSVQQTRLVGGDAIELAAQAQSLRRAASKRVAELVREDSR